MTDGLCGCAPRIHSLGHFHRTGNPAYNVRMAFAVTLTDATIEYVDDADSYQLEGPLTTFFLSDGRANTLSTWSVRVASLRTDRIVSVRRVDREPAHLHAAR